MATSTEKLAALVRAAREDDGKLGSIIRPLLIVPFLRGQVKELLAMPANELDELLRQVIHQCTALRSDDLDEAIEHLDRQRRGIACQCTESRVETLDEYVTVNDVRYWLGTASVCVTCNRVAPIRKDEE